MTKADNSTTESTASTQSATTEKPVRMYHPTHSDVSNLVAADAVESWQAAGWRKTPIKA